MNDNIEGLPGELVERLMAAVNPPKGSDWTELTWWLVFAIGGDRLSGIIPDFGLTPAPGTEGSELRKYHQLVNRDVYLNEIENRLVGLVKSGLREDVLVMALRDELTRQLKGQSDTDRANERRQATREIILRNAEDPDTIAKFRAHVAQDNPEYLVPTDAQVAEQFRSMANKLLPIPLEGELDLWARLDRWTERANSLISDETIAEWLDKYAKRMASGSYS